jgi:hypothetical protein
MHLRKPGWRAHAKPNLGRFAWRCYNNVTRIEVNLTEQLGLLFEKSLQRYRERSLRTLLVAAPDFPFVSGKPRV